MGRTARSRLPSLTGATAWSLHAAPLQRPGPGRAMPGRQESPAPVPAYRESSRRGEPCVRRRILPRCAAVAGLSGIGGIGRVPSGPGPGGHARLPSSASVRRDYRAALPGAIRPPNAHRNDRHDRDGIRGPENCGGGFRHRTDTIAAAVDPRAAGLLIAVRSVDSRREALGMTRHTGQGFRLTRWTGARCPCQPGWSVQLSRAGMPLPRASGWCRCLQPQ